LGILQDLRYKENWIHMERGKPNYSPFAAYRYIVLKSLAISEPNNFRPTKQFFHTEIVSLGNAVPI
jgi:hypothetical protein